MKQSCKLIIYTLFLLLMVGCEKEPANLAISQIDFTETYRNVVLDLPNGVFMPDNPDFDFNKPETWTGNMAQYVNHNYLYTISYEIKNTGGTIAYDTEIDLYYTYDNGDEYVETIYIGNIMPDERYRGSSSTGCTNKQLVKCSCEVFWYD